MALSLLTTLLTLLAVLWYQLPQTGGQLAVHVLDVGQGDAILIRTPTNQKILIDGGSDVTVMAALGAELGFFERRIDLIVLTHPDADHLSGYSNVLRRYKVGGALLTGVQHDTKAYIDILTQLREQQIPVYLADSSTDLDWGSGVMLDLVSPPTPLVGQSADDLNATSIIARLSYGATSILLTGDADRIAEMALLRTPVALTSQILKLGHHGSNSSSSAELLRAVGSDIALVSAGVDNPYGHPHAEVLARVADQTVLSTAESGTLSFVSDGQRWHRLDK